MGAYLDLPAYNALMKEWYGDQTVQYLSYDDNPSLTMLPKDENATGKYIPVPLVWALGQGGSNTFANAQGNQTPNQYAEFLITLKPNYQVQTLVQQALEASADSPGAFMKAHKSMIDGAIQNAANREASALFRTGTGSIAQVSSTTAPAAGVITLSNPADISQIEYNMTLQAASTDGGAPRAALGYVIGRNVQAGTFTVSATALGGPAGSPSGWAAGDYLLVQGDSNAKLSGLAGWLPSVAPSAFDNWYGVNRSPDSRLYGLYYPGAQEPIEEALIDAAMYVRREKGRPRHAITNYGSEAALIKAIGARREYVDWESEDGTISFRGVKIQGPAGPIEIFADRNCQAATAWLLQMDTWKLYSLGPVPKIFKYGDGLDTLRLGNADALELRVGDYANLACQAPGWSSQVALGV